MTMAEISEKLKEMREQSGLRQEQIARFLGVTQTCISKVESGERNLTVDQLEKLVSLYGCSLEMFLQGDTDLHPLKFAYRAQEVSEADLRVIAEIGRIAVNSALMTELLEKEHN